MFSQKAVVGESQFLRGVNVEIQFSECSPSLCFIITKAMLGGVFSTVQWQLLNENHKWFPISVYSPRHTFSERSIFETEKYYTVCPAKTDHITWRWWWWNESHPSLTHVISYIVGRSQLVEGILMPSFIVINLRMMRQNLLDLMFEVQALIMFTTNLAVMLYLWNKVPL